ncbi:hypothetical protein [Almyronema epifaneia]|uniref:Uncharacterized protein n=1 Tax=Almyronema epifaneia S1 TaxID=2991925 RepID=A0ABW6IKC1_9CYAN
MIADSKDSLPSVELWQCPPRSSPPERLSGSAERPVAGMKGEAIAARESDFNPVV